MKEYREVLQFGTFYRLKSPFEGNETVWMVTNEDRTLTAGEVPGNVTPCTDFESRIYMLKGKKVQEGR